MYFFNCSGQAEKILINESHIRVEESRKFVISYGGEDIGLVMPLKAITNSSNLNSLFILMDSSKVQVTVDVKESDLPLKGLFHLTQVNFHDR